MIPLVDLQAQYERIRLPIRDAIDGVLDSGRFVLGPEVESFESEFARYCNVEYAIGVNSGTSALHLALLAADVGPGDEVITVPFTFVATAMAVLYTGAVPVFVDIDPHTFAMDPSKVESAITAKTKAIMPVHLYGQMADMDPLLAIAKRHDLIVIEDAAQAHGAEYKGQRAGSMGDLGCFSFYPGKNLGAYGEGGAVTTKNSKFDHVIRMLRDWGGERKYEHKIKAFNYRLEELQAAILRVKLAYLEEWTEERRENARRYRELLQGSALLLPLEESDRRHVYHIFAVRSGNRAELQDRLLEAGVFTGIHYPIPVHLQPALSHLGYSLEDFPEAEQAAKEVLSLPMYPELTAVQVQTVAQGLLKG